MLNRLLDFVRWLYVPDTQETIRPHAVFTLFATQNPASSYGGNFFLARVRNCFIELHFDELAEDEVVTILHQRSEIPESYAHRLVDVMRAL